jgi:hypothetical protein
LISKTATPLSTLYSISFPFAINQSSCAGINPFN